MIADIQRFMNENGYDVPHTTVIYGSGVMKKRVEEDRDYKDVLNGIKERIRIN
jgi:hypothetical protein